ncbi:cold shock domain-containing protein [Iodobacter sp. HSC-16F04]|uniref:Cold shock domain-containing protein n=1 Tax=Iodobacter violaceini TaxID=3044271 RepID=A0ABX0KKX4_9NEIS|nr:cold shock domain-containing protein [Iodobacter violacea]NHQ84743.1 cold shock domain-containing protein [Iodobacter violacea]
MRYQGRISEWKDERGFGFITPNGGGPKVFLHISSFSRRARRPVVGVFVTYELYTDEIGRPKANAAQFVGELKYKSQESNPIIFIIFTILLVMFVAYIAFVRISHPGSTVTASVYKIFSAREALRSNPQFQCEPEKSSCSRMSSCAEALFHQERCDVSNMDGDRDGIPCEQQWCK